MSHPGMRTVRLPSGEQVPALGQGTWQMGDSRTRRREEIGALQCGIDLGMTLVDTAEMYGDGASEQLVGEAIAGRRDTVFLVSKVLPTNASRRGTIRSCERSLGNLGTDRLDLYLLHWRGNVPLAETLEAFAALVQAGKIRHWGVSNFDPADMQELWLMNGAQTVATNQVLYNPGRRGIEHDLLPWCRGHGVPVMAYSPIEQGALATHPVLTKIAREHQATPAQIALAWVLRHDNVIAIPKAGRTTHVRDNHAALRIQLTTQDLATLDQAFPPPTRSRSLEMI